MSSPTKRKQSEIDSLERSVAKRPRVERSSEVSGSGLLTDNNTIVEIQKRLEEVTKRCSELEQNARLKSEALQKATDRVKCGICLDTMRNPYTLECGHSACLKCLKRSFITSRELSGYPTYAGEGYFSVNDDSSDEEGGDETAGPSHFEVSTDTFFFTMPRSLSQAQRPQHPHRNRFRSVINCRKECHVCRREIRHRPVVDYTLRHVIDDLRLPPLSSAALSERDLRWGRRRDVWRGIFPADPYADNHQQAQRPARGAIANQRRAERRAHPYAGSAPLTAHSLRSLALSLAPAPAPAPPPFPSPAASRQSSALPADAEPEPEFYLGEEVEASVPVPHLDGIDIFFPEDEAQVVAEVAAPQASLALPQLEHIPSPAPAPPSAPPSAESDSSPQPATQSPPLPQSERLSSPSSASSSAPSSAEPNSPPQPTIQEILEILRPRPRTNSTDTAENKEAERMDGGVSPERATEDESQDPDDEDEDEDENIDLIHAMLHGESANTVPVSDSSAVERYPVYIEELGLPAERDGAWLGANLED